MKSNLGKELYPSSQLTDELLDLVDNSDRVIGQASRSEIYRLGLNNYRVINAFLVNDRGLLWIPRRSANKRIFPLCLDMSVGGHVISDESYEDAFRRELLEELNICLEMVSWRHLGYMTPHDHGVSAFMQVYEIRSNLVPAYNRDDFVEYSWVEPEEVLKQIGRGERAKDDLPKLIKIFFQSQ